MEQSSNVYKYGIFGGVFTPNVLTILGVIMYLRFTWVVGNAGLIGTLVILLIAKSVTICTGLSLSSITTNIRIGAGGAYSIISKSLGLEAGGSIGIPFYTAQTLSAGLYILGFTEGWLRLFPTHPPIIVATLTWLVIWLISYLSTRFAIRIQYLIMAVIAISIGSFFLSPVVPRTEPLLLGNYQDAGFWQVFAIFFPAVTGIMAGANMSGELQNPKRAIPIGTLSAIFVTTLIYGSIAFFCAFYIPTQDLVSNPLVMVDYALSGHAIIIGILAATFSSALGSMVGAPRILQALAAEQSVPFSGFLAKKSSRGEPRNTTLVTGVFIGIAILPKNLDALASLITMFFLITYGTLNLVVFIQQSMNMISFRPSFVIPKLIPLIGAVGSIGIMFLINPIFSLCSISVIILIYVILTRRGLGAKRSDIRGGMFLMMAEKLSHTAQKFRRYQVCWKPDLLIPIDHPEVWGGCINFIYSITGASGSIYAFSVREEVKEEDREAMTALWAPLRKQKTTVNSTVIEDYTFQHGAKLTIQALSGHTFHPNILFLSFSKDNKRDRIIKDLGETALKYKMGVILLHQHPKAAFGVQKDINIWLRTQSLNWHLAMLIALQLQSNWGGELNVITVAKAEDEKDEKYRFLERLGEKARLPYGTEFKVLMGNFKTALEAAPKADINIFGASPDFALESMRRSAEQINSSCIFVADSGKENIFA